MGYEIAKALHLVAVISWMAGLLYLPRLFVYHADCEPGSVRAETFKVMERRLLKAIMNPAMMASLVFGAWMIALSPWLLLEFWMQAKIACVAGLVGCHMKFASMRRHLEADGRPRPARAYRIWNEAPTVLMVVIVFMAVLRPRFDWPGL